MKCATGLSRKLPNRLRICASPMIGDLESRDGASPMRLTFQRGGAEWIAGSLMNEGKTGSERLNGLANGKTAMLLTGS